MNSRPLRIVVFGYHTIGYRCLKELLECGEEVSAVVTHEDDPSEHVWFESVSALGQAAGIAVLTPKTPNSPAFMRYLRTLQPDLILSFYYRRLLSSAVLAMPRLGAINLHGSLLPKYRGRAPVNWVLVNGETQTGVTLHYMTEQADAGDIIAQRPVDIAFEDTALTLFEKVAQAAVELLRQTFPCIKAGIVPRQPQDPTQATYFGARTPDDGRIDWDRPALGLYNLVRAVTTPYPGAFTFLHGKKLYVWSCRPIQNGAGERQPPGTILGTHEGGCLVATGQGSLLLTQVQLQGEEVTAGEAWFCRYGLATGTRLGEERG
ncbi:MAG TPA: formyltransferase [Candidatus Tectomicrobia bacterium]|nr:formyltransferase [Candidatus Tectomicrobia bacterium]